MLDLPMPASTSPKKGAAASCGRLLLMAALDVPKKNQAGSASPTSPALRSSRGSSPAREGLEDAEDGSPEKQGEHDAETKHAFGWYLIRSAFSGLRTPTKDTTEENSPAQGRVERGYSVDLMESMEEGHAHEMPTDFVVPLRRSSKLWRFRVMRSEDNLSCRLLTDSGDFLMYAGIRLDVQRVDFHLYDPSHKDLYNQDRPIFTMGYNSSKDTWRLVQDRCSPCQYLSPSRSCHSRGKQQIAIIKHKQHVVGEGVSNIMEVIIPGLYQDDTCVVWCPMMGMGDLADADAASGESQTLITRKPVWNEQVQSLVLDFKGRNIVSSAKNFQLALRQKPQHVICQYGKLGPTNFGLDFRYPLSVVQAFACAVSTIFWT